MRLLSLVLTGLLFAPCAGADTVYKCLDAKGRVIYQSEDCARSHLKEAARLDPVPEVSPEEAERIRAETENTRARLDAQKKAEEEAETKARLLEQEERRTEAMERQARAAEEQARAAEEKVRTPDVIVVPRHVPALQPRYAPRPHQPPARRCPPGDRRCR